MTTETKVSNYQIQFVNRNGVIDDATDSAQTAAAASPIEVQLHNYSYGVSAWFYIHPQPPTLNPEYANDINVFNFGETGPSVSYSPKTNALNVSIAGVKMPSEPIPPMVDVPLQRWNNLVINSDKGAIDIFINGKLIYTGMHVPEITRSIQIAQAVVIGQETGVQGEICNMVLNREPFTKAEIAWFYKTNSALNPPVVGVNERDRDSQPNPMSFSQNGSVTAGSIAAVFGALFGWLFNNPSESTKGAVMGAIAFGLIGALLGALFSTDGMVANVMKTAASVFVDTF
jgi:uncharacterized membrane protein YeaQ/YmgE (transglycosylase-associated protein family)